MMLVGDPTMAEVTLTLLDGVIVRPPLLRWQLPGDTSLEPDRFGWVADLAGSGAVFFGHRFVLRIETSSQPVTDAPPSPSRAELALASAIIENLPSILATCEAKFTEYNANSTAPHHIHDPHIWICREFIEEGSRWAFVVGRDDAPDFGYHLEFDGLKYLGMSAGD